MTTKKNDPATRGREKAKADKGQGSKGHFGDDGDWGGSNDDLKKAQRKSSLVTIKERK